jgi:4a-hydroxytetrahydrobiopterin dehydratase
MINPFKPRSLHAVAGFGTALMLLCGGSAIANPQLVRLSEAEVSTQLQQLPGWTTDGQQLSRTYEFANFVESIAFVNRLVEPAEAAGHHPDIAISYNKVTVSLTTHDAGGLTTQDFELARVISQLGDRSNPSNCTSGQ